MRSNKVLTIAGHEFRSVAGTKTFKVITVLGPLLIFAVTVLPSLLAGRLDPISEGSRIAVSGANEETLMVLQEAFSSEGVSILSVPEVDSVEDMLYEDDALQGFLLIPGELLSSDELVYYSKTGTDVAVSEMLRAVIGSSIVSQRMRQAGFDAGQIRSLSAMPSLSVKKISRSGDQEEGGLFGIIMTSIAFIMLLYMSVLLYGQMIGRSIVLEKTTKTVEILLSSARSEEIMFGKILGIGSAGLLQYAIWIGAALVIITTAGPIFDLQLPSSINLVTLFYLLVFFMTAFLLYSGAYAAFGAAAEDEQNLGQLSWPLIVFLVIPMVMISSIVMNPRSLFTTVLSYFPPTSSMVMFIRVMIQMPEPWEILLCLAIQILSIVLMILAAGRIFRVGILMHGKRRKFGEILRWVHL